MDSTQSQARPPLTTVAFRVGVTGHRPNRLGSSDPVRLDATVRRILETVREAVLEFHGRTDRPAAYATDAPILRLTSSLAEGADRIVSRQALDLGFALCCPMPFAQEEFERDFTVSAEANPSSLEEFRALLTRAREGEGLITFELDGHRADEGAAYGAAGRVVINQSDLLLVLWDGREPRGIGGTVQTMNEAVRFQVPVLWIDAVAPHPWQLVRDERDLPPAESPDRSVPRTPTEADWVELARVVTATLEWPPAENAAGPESLARPASGGGDLREIYFSEKRPLCNPAPFWKLFRSLVGEGRPRLPALSVPDFVRSAAAEWPTADARAPGSCEAASETVAEWANLRLRTHFAWADRLADFYADKYRSSFVLAYPLAAIAVALALLPLTLAPVWHSAGFDIVCIVAELVAIAAILGLVYVGKWRRWHDRWLEYRLLAEVIRLLRVLIPLGGGRPFIRMPGHLENYGEPSRTWMFAFMRALGRSTGLPSARVDAAYSTHYLQYLRSIVAGQRRFHERNERRAERIDHTLHRTAFVLLALTIIGILMHLAPFLHWSWLQFLHEPAIGRWLTFATATLPAFGSALAGINNQGEFSRVAKRSRAMAHRMKHLAGDIDTLERRAAATPGSVRLEHVTPLALHIVQLMVDENLEWRVVFTDRPPTLPA